MMVRRNDYDVTNSVNTFNSLWVVPTLTITPTKTVTRTNPVAALELATPLPQSRARDDLLVHSASQWMVSDSAAASIWVAKVQDQNLRDRLVLAMATASAERDGLNAAAFAMNGISSREEQERAAILIVQRWSQDSPEAVASWVSQFQDSPLRDAAVQNLLTLWTIRDPEAAETWLRDLPAGSLRDAAIAANIHALGNRAGMLISQTLPGTTLEEPRVAP